MDFVKLSSGEFVKFEKDKPLTVIYLNTEKSKKYNRDLIRAYDRNEEREIVFPLYENIKLALNKINIKPGDVLRITWVDDIETKNGTAKKFDVEYAQYETVEDFTDVEKSLIKVFQQNLPNDDEPPF